MAVGEGNRSRAVIKLWDVAGSKMIGKFEAHRDFILALSFSRNGRRIVSASADRTAVVLNIGDGKRVAQFSQPGRVTGANFCADENRVVSCDSEGTVKIWRGIATVPPPSR